MSRPWKVALTLVRRWRVEVSFTIRLIPASDSRRARAAVVGPDEAGAGASVDGYRRARGADAGIDHREKYRARRKIAPASRRAIAPATIDCAGMPWVMSITAGSGAIDAITPFIAPT